MELANCFVRLNGDIGFEVKKTRIPFAEVRILQEVHGYDSVVRIERAGTDDRKAKDVLEHLKSTYGESRVRAAFPGANPNISLQLRDILPDAEDEGDEAEPADPAPAPKKGKGKKAAEPAPEATDEAEPVGPAVIDPTE